LKRTVIKENASIGAGSVLLGGIVIGANAMIGAGAVVTKNIPPFTLWVGNPARQTGFVTREGKVLSLGLKDKSGIQYKLLKDEPVI
jgi:acetyltransferase-like isoleucine patch superfamily enzyme